MKTLLRLFTFLSMLAAPAHAAPGDLDPLDVSVFGNYVLATAVQPDGKMILAGHITSVLGVPRRNIARLNADGTLDMGFDPKADDWVWSVAVQADGKVLLGGSFGTLQPNGAGAATARQYIARVNADGTLDTGFVPKASSIVMSVAVQADGKVLLGGSFTTLQHGATAATARQFIARVNANGTLDMGFDPKASGAVRTLAVQADGKVLLGGDFGTLQPNGAGAATLRRYIARVNADGTLDTGFDPKADGIVSSVAVQADGKVLLGGSFNTLQPNGAGATTTRNRIARVNADGTLDTGFDPKPNSYVASVAVQADGKVLLGGEFTTLQPNGAGATTTRNRIARVNADGTLDTGFDPNTDGGVYNAAVQADGKVLLGGGFTTLRPNGAGAATARNRFARLVNYPATQTLTAPDATQALWTRGGSAPEVSQVTFELSTNGGTSYTLLPGTATRVGGTANWQLTGLSLPASGHLRARGRTAGGNQNGGSGMVESVATYPLTAIETWRQTHFGTTADTGDAANTFDFDGDGLVNLVEFAFGLNPTQPGTGPLPRSVTTDGTTTYSFTQPRAVGNIIYRAEWSTTLLPGSWTPIQDTGTATQHVFSVPATSHGRIFTRLAVTAP